MLKRLRIRNWRCFDDFTIEFGPAQCLVGDNGVGKSSVMDLLERIRRLVGEQHVVQGLFPATSAHRATFSDATQEFELTSEIGGDEVEYRLVIERDARSLTSKLKHESIRTNRETTFRNESGNVKLGRDADRSNQPIPFLTSGSLVGQVDLSVIDPASKELIDGIKRLQILRINPFNSLMNRSHISWGLLDADAGNFVEWMRQRNEPNEFLAAVSDATAEVLPSIEKIDWFQDGSKSARLNFWLTKEFDAQDIKGEHEHWQPRMVFLDDLSDGQRCLLVMYALLVELRSEPANSPCPRLVCLDEPFNFVALSEIQPILAELIDMAHEGRIQLIVSGHHPEIIDFFGSSNLTLLYRNRDDRIVARPFPTDDDAMGLLTPSQVLARGWRPLDAHQPDDEAAEPIAEPAT